MELDVTIRAIQIPRRAYVELRDWVGLRLLGQPKTDP